MVVKRQPSFTEEAEFTDHIMFRTKLEHSSIVESTEMVESKLLNYTQTIFDIYLLSSIVYWSHLPVFSFSAHASSTAFRSDEMASFGESALKTEVPATMTLQPIVGESDPNSV